MVTVCLTNVTALILNLMTSQELLSGEQEYCCPFLPMRGLYQLKGSLLIPSASKHTIKSIRRKGLFLPALAGRPRFYTGLLVGSVSIDLF